MDFFINAPSTGDLNLPYLKYIYIFEASRTDIRVFSFGQENCRKDKKALGPQQQSYYTLHYVIDGLGTYSIGGKSFEIGRHTFFLVPPNRTVSYHQNPDCPWSYYWIDFGGVCCPDLVERCFRDGYILKNDNRDIVSVFENFIRNNTNSLKSNKDLRALSAFYRIIEIISDGTSTDLLVDDRDHADKKHVKEALTYVARHYEETALSTSVISQKLNLHPNYFSTIFKKYTKQSFMKYLTSFRLNAACQLLKITSMPIGEIAISVGFADPLYFSKVFRAHFFMTPKQYRNHSSAMLP